MKEVAIIGTGMGSKSQLTLEAQEQIRQADCLVGSARLLELGKELQKPLYQALTVEAVQHILDTISAQKIAVLVSGDTGFFSAARNYKKLQGCCIRFYPGISSVAAFCAKLQLSWENVRLLSLHGNQCNLVQEVVRHSKVFCLTGNNVQKIGQQLCAYDLGNLTVYVGENLSSAAERIQTCTVAQLAEMQCAPMTVLFIMNEHATSCMPLGIPDALFIRGPVPMTKQEIRTLVISQLRLKPQMICWDVGAGTGSVSVEMALQAWQGEVYAIECKAAGIELITANKYKWQVAHLYPIAGMAPEVLQALPVPDAVFIGGSQGNLSAILQVVLKKNPQARIVATAVTLESIQQLHQLFLELKLADVAVTQIAVSRVEMRGCVHLLQAQNPIFIFSGGGTAYGTDYDSGNGQR